MATEAILAGKELIFCSIGWFLFLDPLLTDVGMLYKRLFNHRPIIQNEVHYFVREFEVF